MKFKIIIAVLLIISSQVSANDPFYQINDETSGFIPFNLIQVLINPATNLTDEDILNSNNLVNQKYIEWSEYSHELNLSANSIYWFKFSVKPQSNFQRWLISPGFWHQSQLFYRTSTQNWKSVDTSVFLALSQRQYPSDLPMVLLNIPQDGLDIMIKTKGFRLNRKKNAQHIQIKLEEQYLSEQREIIGKQNIYIGFAIAIGGFHLVLFFWFRERSYFWMVVGFISAPIFFHAISGLGLTRIWPNLPVWNEYSPSVLSSLITAIYLQFSASFLNLKESIPRVEKVVKIFIYLNILFSMSIFYHNSQLILIKGLLMSVSSVILFLASIYLAKSGVRYAWFFVAGNIFVMASLFLWPIITLNHDASQKAVISIVTLTQLSSAFLGIMLALGLINRMQMMRQKMLTQALQSEREIVHQEQQTKALIQAQNVELELSNKALKKSDDLKDDFLAKTSHGLNTPLNAIIGLSQVLLDKKVNLNKVERSDYLGLIVKRGTHLKELVNELLDFVKTRKEVINLYHEKINLRTRIEKISLTFKSQIKQKGLTFILDSLFDINVFIDANRLRQMLSILLDNAIKYTDKGHIRVFMSHDESLVFIHVEDTGIGIKTEDLKYIFEPFLQLKQKNKLLEGAGLGLSICKHLVEIHDGELLVESTFGQGSTFTIQLPIYN